MNGAEAIVKCLKNEGVEVVFGYSGVAIDPFWNALKMSGIKGVLVRTEQNAGHAASGYARVSEKIGVCAVTSGPGATNLLTGIATAYADSIPLVCITGQVETSQIGSDVFQEADVIGAAESFVKYSFLVKDARDLPRVFKEAFFIAGTGRKGPVLIDVPQDVAEAQMKDFVYPESDPALRTYKPTVKGHIVQIRKVAKELEKAKKPLICCGGGIHLSGAREEFKAFAEKHRLPVVWTMMGLGVLPSDHDMGLGMVGNNGHACANRAMRECDLLIMMGARVADRAVADPELTFDGKVLVHIDVDPAEIGKNVGPTIPIVGDVKHILSDLLEMEIKSRPHEDWIASLYGYRSEYRAAADKKKGRSGYVDAPKFVSLLSSMLEEDAVYVADVGQNQIISCLNCEIKNGRFLTSGGMGTMGYSIPAALGAKKARPSRQVVAVCGDGAFQMSMMELALIRQEDLPVKIVVMKNQYLGLVREHQKKTYPGDCTMVALGVEPDLKHIAAAYGIDYFLAEETKGLKDRITKFLNSEGGAILEVRIDPEADVK